MNVSKDVTITLTPKEAEKIILDHLNSTHAGFNMKTVHFDIKREYGEYGDHSEYHSLGEVRCEGKLVG